MYLTLFNTIFIFKHIYVWTHTYLLYNYSCRLYPLNWIHFLVVIISSINKPRFGSAFTCCFIFKQPLFWVKIIDVYSIYFSTDNNIKLFLCCLVSGLHNVDYHLTKLICGYGVTYTVYIVYNLWKLKINNIYDIYV